MRIFEETKLYLCGYPYSADLKNVRLVFILLSPALRAAGEQVAGVIFQRCRISHS